MGKDQDDCQNGQGNGWLLSLVKVLIAFTPAQADTREKKGEDREGKREGEREEERGRKREKFAIRIHYF